MQKTEFRTIPTDDLIPYARNSRTHSPDQVTKIAASIKEFGFLNPIIVDGENGIVSCHFVHGVPHLLLENLSTSLTKKCKGKFA